MGTNFLSELLNYKRMPHFLIKKFPCHTPTAAGIKKARLRFHDSQALDLLIRARQGYPVQLLNLVDIHDQYALPDAGT